MDSSEWKKLNSNIQLKDARKRLFGQYYCNVKYYCPGGRILSTPTNNTLERIEDAVEVRKQFQRQFNYGGSWRAQRENTEGIVTAQLFDLMTVKNTYNDTIRLRVEEPYVTIYSETEETLNQLASTELTQWRKHLVSVTRPESDAIKNILDSNAIIIKKDVGYRYKFMCKDGLCPNKQSIHAYLDSISDQVKLSKTVLHNLTRPNKYIWGVWFYGNDPDLAKFLNIIEPNFVTNIHELVKA
jgi:hypothetical protein